jgi:hypothetical protein
MKRLVDENCKKKFSRHILRLKNKRKRVILVSSSHYIFFHSQSKTAT